MEQLRVGSLINPRESFKQTASKLAKSLIKIYPFMEPLIVEKVRRRSSAMKSSDSSEDVQSLPLLSASLSANSTTSPAKLTKKEERSQSMQFEPIDELEDH